MAPVGKKRLRENESEREVSNKKRNRGPKISSSGAQNSLEKNITSLDELAWKEVLLPDRLDDAEGFFGLEEIDDVEVIKGAQEGSVRYKVVPKNSRAKVANRASESKRTSLSTKRGELTDEQEDGEEWGGLDDGPTKPSLGPEKVLGSDQNDQQLSKQRKLKKARKKLGPSGEDTSMNGNEFNLLNVASEDEADVTAWQSLQLSSETLLSLARLKFSNPTPIQKSAIPEILKGHDVVGKASTGSGKTLAFGIPILEYHLSRLPSPHVDRAKGSQRQSPPIALIISPTRELAHQLSAHLEDLCSSIMTSGPSIVTLTGGLSLQKQQRLLAKADIIVGTPGRLWEVIGESQGLLHWLTQIKFLVVDEADRLLSEGHFKEAEQILEILDREYEDANRKESDEDHKPSGDIQRQMLVFSATFERDLQQKLAGKDKNVWRGDREKQESMEYLLHKLKFREERPKFIDVDSTSQMASGLKEGILECTGLEKDLYLYALLLHHRKTRTLIFANSISSVRRLTPFLQTLDIKAHSLHSQMPQKARLRAVERFASPSEPGSILIATDVAARGLDIPSVHLVIHYHLPRAADMYVHRSGRTARGENSGTSILLCAPQEVAGVRRLVNKVHHRDTGNSEDGKKSPFLQNIEMDRLVVNRLKPRVTLSKRISDALQAKEKANSEDSWLRSAANELGVEYDSDEFAAQGGSKKGRGEGRRRKESEARGLSKEALANLKAELRDLLSQRVNVGVSERYLSAGGIDVDELLKEGKEGDFLGRVDGLDLE